ncbi:2TM domain-containing protein [Archangium violaceum]|uniref:2TM domain-containing protein n=1 Tax=Archangium violaceum TaxID=83451 RepID=UPI000698C862|nr:2TM domain-containing protein [Archangium violaceum]
MPDIKNDNPSYERAHKRVEELRGFYMHLLVYLAVSLGLFLLDQLSPGEPWFFWPVISWGIFVLIHGATVLLDGSFLGERWEERKTRQLMERDRERSGGPPRPPQPLAP